VFVTVSVPEVVIGLPLIEIPLPGVAATEVTVPVPAIALSTYVLLVASSPTEGAARLVILLSHTSITPGSIRSSSPPSTLNLMLELPPAFPSSADITIMPWVVVEFPVAYI
jgi:hypothetical protein